MQTTLIHPGPALKQRIISVPTLSRGVVTRLTPGLTVLDHLAETLHDMGTDSGFAELYAGSLEPVNYCVPTAGDGVLRMVGFSASRRSGHGDLISGSATIGLRDGRPFMHCHSFWTDPRKRRLGGHLWPETTAGLSAPYAAVYGIFGGAWTSADDPETNMPVFTPSQTKEKNMSDPAFDGGLVPTVVSRILPNEDITDAVARVCAEAGYESAVVRAGLGSLIGATFIDRATGHHRLVDGPGTEVVSLSGHAVRNQSGYDVTLTCTLVDRHGTVHAGELVAGENPVAITFELVLQKIA